MNVDGATIERHGTDTDHDVGRRERLGSLLMALAGVAFVGYGVVFLARTFFGTGFELGVATLNGVTPADLDAIDPAIMHYITHLHVATAAFIIATGIAVTALAWYGVRSGLLWAWAAAVVTAVVGLAIALPMHYMDLFTHNWVTHLGPIYLATIVFVIGAGVAYLGLRSGPQAVARANVQAARVVRDANTQLYFAWDYRYSRAVRGSEILTANSAGYRLSSDVPMCREDAGFDYRFSRCSTLFR